MTQDKSKWSALANKELRDKSAADLTWKTLEGINIDPLYTQEDLKGLEHLGSLPGEEPFTRGVSGLRCDFKYSAFEDTCHAELQ